MHVQSTAITTPFCNQSFKGLRVTGEVVGRACYALALKVVSLALLIFNYDYSSYCSNLGDYQVNKALSTLYIFLSVPSKQIINFSVNGCVINPPKGTALESLHARYGDRRVEKWIKEAQPIAYLQKNSLMQKSLNEGVCFGMSMDFVKQYQKEIRKGSSVAQAVHSISGNFAKGASDKAQLAQLMHNAIRLSQEAVFHYDPTTDKTELTQKMRLEYNRQRNNVIAKQFHFQMEKAQCLDTEKIPSLSDINNENYSLQTNSQQIETFLKNLSDGCYCTTIKGNKSAHSVVIIKSGENYYLFDPNHGTFSFTVAELQKKLKHSSRSVSSDFFSSIHHVQLWCHPIRTLSHYKR